MNKAKLLAERLVIVSNVEYVDDISNACENGDQTASIRAMFDAMGACFAGLSDDAPDQLWEIRADAAVAVAASFISTSIERHADGSAVDESGDVFRDALVLALCALYETVVYAKNVYLSPARLAYRVYGECNESFADQLRTAFEDLNV